MISLINKGGEVVTTLLEMEKIIIRQKFMKFHWYPVVRCKKRYGLNHHTMFKKNYGGIGIL